MRSEPRASDPFAATGLALLSVEETIALVERATPSNARAEVQRLSSEKAMNRRLRPAFDYERAPDLSALRGGLETLARELSGQGRLGALYAARAEELELEARMIEHLGTADFLPLAARRFREPSLEVSARVNAFIDDALAGTPPATDTFRETNASDDELSAASLVSQLRRRAAELALSIRVEIRPRQLATAATGRGVVGVRPGVLLSADTTSRIVIHELLAHALPRARSAHAPLTLLRSGSHGSMEHEEGRAVLVEARAGYLGKARRRELALRHVAALAVRRGADFDETVRELALRGAEVHRAIEIAVRVHRGGGLAREVVYLPAYFEVTDAFAREPGLERWFERGRVGVDAARELALLAAATEPRPSYSSNSMNTGA
jgi:hypothetical protein